MGRGRGGQDVEPGGVNFGLEGVKRQAIVAKAFQFARMLAAWELSSVSQTTRSAWFAAKCSRPVITHFIT